MSFIVTVYLHFGMSCAHSDYFFYQTIEIFFANETQTSYGKPLMVRTDAAAQPLKAPQEAEQSKQLQIPPKTSFIPRFYMERKIFL